MHEPTLIEQLDAQLDEVLRRDVWPLIVKIGRVLEDAYNPAVRASIAAQESTARLNGAGRKVVTPIRHNTAFASSEAFILDVFRRHRSGALDPAPKL